MYIICTYVHMHMCLFYACRFVCICQPGQFMCGSLIYVEPLKNLLLLNKTIQVQKEYKRWVRHRKWLPEDLRVRCGGVRSSASISPIHSSSSGVNIMSNSFNLINKLLCTIN